MNAKAVGVYTEQQAVAWIEANAAIAENAKTIYRSKWTKSDRQDTEGRPRAARR